MKSVKKKKDSLRLRDHFKRLEGYWTEDVCVVWSGKTVYRLGVIQNALPTVTSDDFLRAYRYRKECGTSKSDLGCDRRRSTVHNSSLSV